MLPTAKMYSSFLKIICQPSLFDLQKNYNKYIEIEIL